MARVIDVQPIIEEIQSSLDITSYSEYDRGVDDGLKYVLDLIKKAPTLTPTERVDKGGGQTSQEHYITLDELLSINYVPIWVVDKTNNRQEWCYWRNGLAYACEDWPEHYHIDDYGKWIAFYYPTEKGKE